MKAGESFEPVVNAVVAALEAQRSAFLTNWLLIILIACAVLVALGVLISLAKIHEIEQHTNGIMAKLIDATRLLGIEEGKDAEQLAEVKRQIGKDVPPILPDPDKLTPTATNDQGS